MGAAADVPTSRVVTAEQWVKHSATIVGLPAVVRGYAEYTRVGEAFVAFDAPIEIIEVKNPFSVFLVEEILRPERDCPMVPLVSEGGVDDTKIIALLIMTVRFIVVVFADD